MGNSGKKERGITGEPVGENFFIIIVMIIIFMKMFLTEHVTKKKMKCEAKLDKNDNRRKKYS